MTRKDLESKVRIRWETADDGRGTRRCEGEFVASCAALVDPLVLRGLGAVGDARTEERDVGPVVRVGRPGRPREEGEEVRGRAAEPLYGRVPQPRERPAEAPVAGRDESIQIEEA